MRRSRLDIRLGRNLKIGQRWRDEDGTVWRIRQVHRFDCTLQMEADDPPRRREVRFGDLRRDWTYLIPVEEVV